MISMGWVSIVASGLLVSGSTPSPHPPEFEPRPCASGVETGARCGVVAVPEDRDGDAEGRTIELSVVVYPARGGAARGAILSFSGGPGQAAAVDSPGSVRQLEPFRDQYDAIYFDQRGTGRSNGLQCSLPEDPVEWFSEGVFSAEALRGCRAKLEERAELEHYTTAPSRDDARDVLDALGYDRVHVRAGSYGTRMAVAFAAAYPDRVASLMLSGVVPPDLTPIDAFSRTAEQAVDRLLSDCEADAPCREAFPSLRREFDDLLERLDAGGVTAEIALEGRRHTVPMDRAAFGYAVRGILYGAGALELPRRFHEAAETGSFDWFAQSYAERAMGVWRGIAIGMHLSSVCSEDVAHVSAGSRANQPGVLKGLLLAEYEEACRVWAVPERSRQPLGVAAKLDIPTLILSGRRDPVTPEQYADRLKRQIPGARSVVFPRGGHGYTGTDVQCVQAIVAAFMSEFDPAGIDATCATGRPEPWDLGTVG